MRVSVEEALLRVPVSRLIHFAPARSIHAIFADSAIRTSQDLGANSPQQYSPTDELRLDKRLDHVCCTFEYPNAYYQARARDKVSFKNYPDWVAFVLDINLVRRPGTLFSPCNAAKGGGRYLAAGGEGLLGCWSNPSTPGGYTRSVRHREAVPTDLQSEVLVPGVIPLATASAVVTPTMEKARELYVHLYEFGLNPGRVQWRYSPLFFEPVRLARALTTGGEVREIIWTPSTEDLR